MSGRQQTETDRHIPNDGSEPVKHAGGRPTIYTQELAQRICEKIATSSMGLKRLSEKYDWFPDKDTILAWRFKHPEFSNQYAEAKRQQIEVYIDELIDISDDTLHDQLINDHGNIVANNEYIQRSRLRIDTRKWLACKLAPKIYGDRVQTEVSGKDGEPIKHEVEATVATPINDRISEMLGKDK